MTPMTIAFDHKFGQFGATKAEVNPHGIVFLTQEDKDGLKHYIILTPKQVKLLYEEVSHER